MGRDATLRSLRRSFRRSRLLLPTFGDDYPSIRRRTVLRMVLAARGRDAVADLVDRERQQATLRRVLTERKVQHFRKGRTGLSGPRNALRGVTSRSLRVAEHHVAESAFWARRPLAGKPPKRRAGSPPPVGKAERRARILRGRRQLRAWLDSDLDGTGLPFDL